MIYRCVNCWTRLAYKYEKCPHCPNTETLTAQNNLRTAIMETLGDYRDLTIAERIDVLDGIIQELSEE